MEVTRKIADWYFTPKKGSEKFYEAIGVRQFKRYLPNGGDLINGLMGKRWFKKSAESLQENDLSFGRTIELIHLGLFGMFAAGTVLTKPSMKLAALQVGLNVLINFYPIMVHRYNRLRINSLLEKMEKRSANLVR